MLVFRITWIELFASLSMLSGLQGMIELRTASGRALSEIQYYLSVPKDDDAFKRNPLRNMNGTSGRVIHEQWPKHGGVLTPGKAIQLWSKYNMTAGNLPEISSRNTRIPQCLSIREQASRAIERAIKVATIKRNFEELFEVRISSCLLLLSCFFSHHRTCLSAYFLSENEYADFNAVNRTNISPGTQPTQIHSG